MPNRLHCYFGAGYSHFITTSCYQRLPLLASARNRDLFVQVLEQVRRRYHFVLAGYVVMPEHVHLLFSEPERGNPSVVMQAIKQSFACRLLARLRKAENPQQLSLWSGPMERGRIWQPRFYDFVVFSEKKRVEKLRYMHRNPGKRGTGAGTRAVAVEQLSTVRLSRSRTRRGESTADGGVESAKNLLISAAVVPSFRTPRKLGQPIRWRFRRIKAGPAVIFQHVVPKK